MPWALLNLDQAIMLLNTSAVTIGTTRRYAMNLSHWYSLCVTGQAAPPRNQIASGEALEQGFCGASYKAISSLCHKISLVPYVLPEHELYR